MLVYVKLQQALYLLNLIGLQEITWLSEVWFECFRLQFSFDGRVMLGVHLLFGRDLQQQPSVSALHITNRDKLPRLQTVNGRWMGQLIIVL